MSAPRKVIGAMLGVVIVIGLAQARAAPGDQEPGPLPDMLTPKYYQAEKGDAFKKEMDRFLKFARMIEFRHPLADSTGVTPRYYTPPMGEFGAGKGPTRSQQHHAAQDFYLGNRETEVTLYAVHDGYVSVKRDAQKYRHYLSITKPLEDDKGAVVGKLVTLYAHIDLDLDEADMLKLAGKQVKQGDIVSRHLYAGTRGGPHLHFEVRYYRAGDEGDEEFYGFDGPRGRARFTETGAGPWPYGVWDPETGYGYANPANFLPPEASGRSDH